MQPVTRIASFEAHDFSLWVKCRACERESITPPAALLERLGPDFRILNGDEAFRQRLICSACGVQDAVFRVGRY